MWFFDSANNPNNAITSTLNASDPSLFQGYDTNSCHLDYYHKATPSEEDDNFTECHPWKQSSCCYQETVSDVDAINQAYGAEYHWDRCGPLSQACERFFVQEACFYECSPNIGLFRKYHPNTFNSSNDSHNAWEVEGMPIKASYCNAWFDACRNDYFCDAGGGNFFECARVYEEQDQATTIVREDKTDAGVVVGIIVACVVAVGALVGLVCLIQRERKGAPMFSPLVQDTSQGGVTMTNNNRPYGPGER